MAQEEPTVLGVTTIMNQTPSQIPTQTPTPLPTLTPTSVIFSTPKNNYTIAIFGDSMIDTMGERLEYLEHSLKKKYPKTNFQLYNYGIGAQTVEQGVARLNSSLDYKDRHYPPLTQINPDIIILGSFAYNPFSPYNRDQHWLQLTKLTEEAKKITPNIYLLAEIAPLRSDFGKGPGGVNWETNTAWTHSGHIIEQLENVLGLSKTLNIPIIDAYTPSGGKKIYVNPHDGIHPSVAGHEFTADIITEKLIFN